MLIWAIPPKHGLKMNLTRRPVSFCRFLWNWTLSVTAFRRLAWGVLAFVVAVILWGAVVRATGSGAGCGSHWPLCNGEVLPGLARFQTLIEFAHRASSGLSLLAVFTLGHFAFRTFQKGHLCRQAALFSMVAIVVEALIGAALVLLRLVEHDQSLDRAVSISFHLVNTSFLIGALTVTAYSAGLPRPRFFLSDRTQRRKTLLLLSGFVALGATGALTALGDTLFRPSSLAAGILSDWGSQSHFLERLRILHPILALGWVAAMIPWLQTQALGGAKFKFLSRWVLMLLVGNLSLGLSNVLLLAPLALQVVHLLVANLIWIFLIALTNEAATADSVWIGEIKSDELSQLEWISRNLPPDDLLISQGNRPHWDGVEVVAFIGTWCGDTHEQLPGFLQILKSAGFPENQLKIIGLGRDKKFGDWTERYAIARLPTFVVSRGRKEIGRIVESPVVSLEADLQRILGQS